MSGAARLGDLSTRWRALAVAELGASEAAAATWFAEIEAGYGAAARAYHTLAHVAALLDRLESWAARLSDPQAAALAAWFHDLVWAGRPGADERASAARLRAFQATLGEASGVSAPTFDAAETMILATIDHQPPAEAPDARLFLDADLEILAAGPARYDAYATAIRREFAAVPEPAYRAGRTAVLRRFLARPAIYFAMAAWETPARANLAREIATLDA